MTPLRCAINHFDAAFAEDDGERRMRAVGRLTRAMREYPDDVLFDEAVKRLAMYLNDSRVCACPRCKERQVLE